MPAQEQLKMTFAPERRRVAELVLDQFRRHATDKGLNYTVSQWTGVGELSADRSQAHRWSQFQALRRAYYVFEGRATQQATEHDDPQAMAADTFGMYAQRFFERQHQAAGEGNTSY